MGMRTVRLNSSNSSLYTAGIYGQRLVEIHEVTNVLKRVYAIPLLGYPACYRQIESEFYAPFLDRITPYICTWRSSSPSYSRRAELVPAVLQGIECFWLSIFFNPTTVVFRIIGLCWNFLWGTIKP